MNRSIDDCKRVIEEYRTSLHAKSGQVVEFSPTGPAGMKCIDALLVLIEAQQKQIDELDGRLRFTK